MGVLVIRPAEMRDADRMAEIARSSPSAPQWTTVRFLELLPPGLPQGPLLRMGLVALSDREVCGFAVASALVSVFPVEAELESLAVDPARQGRGIGLCLLHEVLGWAMSRRAGTLRLEVRAGNERALRIYTRAGFVQTGRRPRYYADPVEDALVMERTLQPSAVDVPVLPLA